MAKRFLKWFQLCTPNPGVRGALNRVQGVSTASTVRPGKKFINQKLQGRTILVGVDHIFGMLIQIWKDLGPMCFWSHGQSFSGKVYYTKVVARLPNSQLGKFLTSQPGPKPGVRDPKQGLERIHSLNCATRRILYKTKVVGQSCFSWGGSCFWARNLDLEGPGPHVLLEPWSIIFEQSLLNKRCSTLGLTYLVTFALTIHFIILI